MTMDETTPLEGRYGKAVKLELKDGPEFSATVCHYLLTCPYVHPFWIQWVLAVVRLDDDNPRYGPANHQFEGSTHELVLVALNPDHGPYDEAKMAAYAESGDLPTMEPINVAWQMQGTDAEAGRLGELAAKAIVHGVLPVEPPLGYESFRESWNESLTRTLAHERGEAHAP